MLLPNRTTALLHLRRLLSSFSTTSHPYKPPKLKNILQRYRRRALSDARSALIDYLHTTRYLPFSLADHIISHSPRSLHSFLSAPSLPSPPSLPRLLRHLSYHPIDEFLFFSESIGLPFSSPIPSPSPFLCDHPHLLPSVSALSLFGFPLSLLGLICPFFLSNSPSYLVDRLRSFESLGLRRSSVIGICLAFPSSLDSSDAQLTSTLFADLRTVFIDYGLQGCVDEDVEKLYRICRRIRVLYDFGSEFGTMGEILGKNKNVILEVEEEELRKKLGFFLRLGMKKEEVGVFVLKNVEVFDMDLEGPDISMPEFLVGMGLSEEEVEKVPEKFPYLMGRNKLGNLPGILRAMGMHEWFAEIISNGDFRYLKPNFASASLVAVGSECGKILEGEFLKHVKAVICEKKHPRYKTKHPRYIDCKVEFLLGIGFGENEITSKLVAALNGTKDQLQERFDCLIEFGMEYHVLCRMISAAPILINQSKESIQEKVGFLLHGLGYPLEYLDNFPSFLCFDLENRIKPRYKITNWLVEQGLLKKKFSPATILANSEKRFITSLYTVHPAVPKQWLEVYSSRSDHHGNQRNLF